MVGTGRSWAPAQTKDTPANYHTQRPFGIPHPHVRLWGPNEKRHGAHHALCAAVNQLLGKERLFVPANSPERSVWLEAILPIATGAPPPASRWYPDEVRRKQGLADLERAKLTRSRRAIRHGRTWPEIPAIAAAWFASAIALSLAAPFGLEGQPGTPSQQQALSSRSLPGPTMDRRIVPVSTGQARPASGPLTSGGPAGNRSLPWCIAMNRFQSRVADSLT
jgi:hypothetical protein